MDNKSEIKKAEEKVKIGLVCDKGGRAYNQDYADYAVAGDYICVAVADGLGSYEGSEIASESAVKCVIQLFRKAVRKEEELFSGATINKFFKSAHQVIQKIKSDSPELCAGSTTLSVVIARQDKLICAHIGDSRIYFFSNDTIEFYSKDHSLARALADRGEISFSEIRNHPDQNKLTRVLGGDYFVQPDYKIHTGFTEKDCVLVCTDGFWEYILEDEMESALSKTKSAHFALNEMKELVLSRAPAFSDNYSAVLLRLGDEDEKEDLLLEGDDTLQNDKSEENANPENGENKETHNPENGETESK